LKVTLELGGPMREKFGQWHTLRLKAGSTIGDALRDVGITEELYIIVARNARRAELTDPLADGDVIVAFPPVGGG
jgi:molybdopterin converting factor small subunit